MRRNYAEQAEQKAIVDWLAWKKYLFCAIPNGGGRSKIEAAILKGQGVVAGAPDLFIFSPTKIAPQGVAVEVKSRTGKLSPAQKEFIHRLWLAGVVVVVGHAEKVIADLEGLGY